MGSPLVGRRFALYLAIAITVASTFASVLGGSGAASRRPDVMASFSATSMDGIRCPKVAAIKTTAAAMPESGLRALARLARVETAPQLAAPSAGMNSMADATAVNMPLAERDALMSELRRAARASCGLLTISAAESAGYYLASPYVDGVGTHWINWAEVDRPFDPARPSMLLFKTIGGVPQLAAFSYWVRSAAPPTGFSGPADHWHRHSGLCFVAGQWAGEDFARSECHGVWLNGGDLWMLHAWVVPDNENPAGIFAPRSRQLCRPHTPDIDACPGQGRPGT